MSNDTSGHPEKIYDDGIVVHALKDDFHALREAGQGSNHIRETRKICYPYDSLCPCPYCLYQIVIIPETKEGDLLECSKCGKIIEVLEVIRVLDVTLTAR